MACIGGGLTYDSIKFKSGMGSVVKKAKGTENCGSVILPLICCPIWSQTNICGITHA